MLRVLTICVFLFLSSEKMLAWGSRGHILVAQIARNYLDRSVMDSIDHYLDGMSFEEAANWMDNVAQNKSYDFMKTWHFVKFDLDKTYVRTSSPDLVNVLENLILKLMTKKSTPAKEMQLSLKLLVHLVADLHQPLHCGYLKDDGGTGTKVRFFFKASNLHDVWDKDILEYKACAIEECTKLASSLQKADVKNIQSMDVRKWMKESRALLPAVYDFKGDKIDDVYVDANAKLIKMQLIKSGIRLAGILNRLFGPKAS